MNAPLRNSRKIFDFHGGIHPPENKTQSSGQPIRSVSLPEELVLPLNMHIGAPAKPIVNVGDQVLKGQKIADANGMVSVPVHAPTSGTVVAIGPHPIQHPSGLDAPCIIIKPDGEERWTALHPITDWHKCSPSVLITRIREAGIAGMGGAGFPTAVKMSLKEGTKIQQLLLNAVECEPYITADDRLMRERADEIVRGIKILQYLVKPAETLVGIEDNKPYAIEAMRGAAQGTDIQIVVVPTKYPSGGEKQLIQLLTGKEVPSGGIPAQIGVVCQNIGSALAMHRAIEFGEPLISRITTVTGDALSNPGNIEVLLGTPVKHLLNESGVKENRLGRVVMGGPMMGFTLHTTNIPVVKTTNCIIAASTNELPEPAPEQPCIRCGSCAEVCPADLLPQQLYWYSKTSDLERAQQYNLMDCIECGACAYVCPSNIPLVQYYRFAKGEVRTQVAEQQKADNARLRFEARQARLEKEAAEKDARRKARLAASKQKAAGVAAPSVDVKALKAASLEASSAYKAAVKELKAAQADDANNVAELSAKVDALKAKADSAKAAVRDANSGAAAPAAPSVDLKALKSASLEASSAYKAAVKAVKAAEQNGDDNVAELRAQADSLKAKADTAKAAVRDANAGTAPATVAAADPVAELKKAVGEASSAYKAAVKAAKEAEESGAEDAAALRSQADQLKATADTLKAQLRDAKDAAPAATAPAPTSAPAAAPEKDHTAERAAKMKALKTSYNMLNKMLKDSNAALERAEREGSDNLDAQRARVEDVKRQADAARNELNDLVDQAKAGIRASGSDLKTMKLEAARTESALRKKMKELDEMKKSADEERINVLYQERDLLKREADIAANALKSALEEQGLTE
ncbi:MAG: electron transport complex subunit RsxC [Alcanivoracaceae bacterium]|nr:electron transport complex subunit RsxC [Alcanivoracaceae bacterium]